MPTTTIGSFPQTEQIRADRDAHRASNLDDAEYKRRMRAEIERVIRLQEELGLDVLVHGEPERNDMVQYFAEHLDGFATTGHGWVQSYGTRDPGRRARAARAAAAAGARPGRLPGLGGGRVPACHRWDCGLHPGTHPLAATIASVAGCYECIEPQVSMVFKRETLSGDFLQVNGYLVVELKGRGLWTPQVRERIKRADGSVQGITELPEDVRVLFRTPAARRWPAAGPRRCGP